MHVAIAHHLFVVTRSSFVRCPRHRPRRRAVEIGEVFSHRKLFADVVPVDRIVHTRVSIAQRASELTAEAAEVPAEFAEETPNSAFLCESPRRPLRLSKRFAIDVQIHRTARSKMCSNGVLRQRTQRLALWFAEPSHRVYSLTTLLSRYGPNYCFCKN